MWGRGRSQLNEVGSDCWRRPVVGEGDPRRERNSEGWVVSGKQLRVEEGLEEGGASGKGPCG